VSKKNHSHEQSAPAAPAAPAVPVAPAPDKRKLGPVERLLNSILEVDNRIAAARQKFESWNCKEKIAPSVRELISEVANRMTDLTAMLAELVKSGYEPTPRSTEIVVGDRVEILEAHRKQYSDLIPVELMLDLKVAIVPESKRGGLVLETTRSSRIRVAATHVRRARQVPHRAIEPEGAPASSEPGTSGECSACGVER